MKTATRGATRRPPTEAQKAAAKARRDQIAELWRQVGEMDDATRARLTEKVGAIVTPEGRELSLNNTLLLMLQRPNATVCGGFQQWLKVGRCVRKGEKALALWVPVSKSDNGADSTPAPGAFLALPAPREGTPAGDPVAKRRPFILGNVFDISQTRPIENEADEFAAFNDLESLPADSNRGALAAPMLALA